MDNQSLTGSSEYIDFTDNIVHNDNESFAIK